METLRCAIIIPAILVVIVLTLDIGYPLGYAHLFFQKDDEGQFHNREQRSGLSDLTTNATTNTSSTATSQTTALVTNPSLPARFLISVEVNLSDPQAVEFLNNFLANTSFPVKISESLQLVSSNKTTVCSAANDSYRCTCAGQYRWSCDQCEKYGHCDDITDDDTCGCITDRPSDGSHCQSPHHYNFDPCHRSTTRSPTTTALDTTTHRTSVSGGSDPSLPARFLISVEVNLSDPQAVEFLNNFLANTSFPVKISESLQLVSSNKTTVCSAANDSYRCTCAGQYRWSCDQCEKYGHCDDITDDDTCGCITDRPSDGSHCQSPHHYNFDPCHRSTTRSPTTTDPTTKTTTDSDTTTKATTQLTKPTNSTTGVSSSTSTVTSGGSITNPSPLRTLRMTITLDLQFNSTNLTELEGNLSIWLENAYKDISGFESASVSQIRQGSVIVDYTVITAHFDLSQIKGANSEFEAILSQSGISVLQPVVTQFNSRTRIVTDQVTYTDTELKLDCRIPDEFGGSVDRSRSEWKHEQISTSNQDISRWKTGFTGDVWYLNISDVILSDRGTYECVHKSDSIHYFKEGIVKVTEAPNMRIDAQRSFQCKNGETKAIECCVQKPHVVQWRPGPTSQPDEFNCISQNLPISCDQKGTHIFTCEVKDLNIYVKNTSVTIFDEDFTCDDEVYGQGDVNDLAEVKCEEGFTGSKIAKCERTGWKLVVDNCLLTKIRNLLIYSKDLDAADVPLFAKNVTNVINEELADIVESPATIDAIVQILDAITNVTDEINSDVAKDIILIADAIIGEDSKESWDFLNANISLNTSSTFLASMESLSDKLSGTFDIDTQRIVLRRTSFDSSFFADLNSSAVISIPLSNVVNVFITTISFPTLLNVMPTRNSSFLLSLFTAGNDSDEHTINAAVVLVKINATVPNVTLEYTKLNQSLTLHPQCVFWNFKLAANFGAWDDEGCTLVSNNDTVVCSCDHLTSFSILMAIDVPRSIRVLLDVITYVGVGISMASLVICIIIEAYVWKELTSNVTGFMKHFSVINIAISLLIANICFIIGASIAKNPVENPGEDFGVPIGSCSTATFFMHFFYLAVFFWMLVLGLLLLYKTTVVLRNLSKTKILLTGLTVGYICPLLIAVITVAVTAPNGGYIRKDYACWLNWIQTKALLALVIPGLTIVFINFIVVIVVVAVLCRSNGRVAVNDRPLLLVVIRLVAILTPLFGLTWGLGVGTMISATNKGIHIAFAFFNSLQGFFILVFGTLFDSKVREVLSKRQPGANTRSNPTGSTSAGVSSSSGFNIVDRFRHRRDVYRVANPVNSSSSGATESFINT